jgi:hypothetical protein
VCVRERERETERERERERVFLFNLWSTYCLKRILKVRQYSIIKLKLPELWQTFTPIILETEF